MASTVAATTAGSKRSRHAMSVQQQQQQQDPAMCSLQEEERLLHMLKPALQRLLVRPLMDGNGESFLHLMETCLVVIVQRDDSEFVSNLVNLCRKRQVPYLMVRSLDSIATAATTMAFAVSNRIEEERIKPFLQLAESKSSLTYTVWRYTRSKIYANLLCQDDIQERVLKVLGNYDKSQVQLGLEVVIKLVQDKQAKLVVFAADLWMESLMEVLTVAFQCSQKEVPCFLLQNASVTTPGWTGTAVCVSQLGNEDEAELDNLQQLAIQKSMDPLPLPQTTVTASLSKPPPGPSGIFEGADESAPVQQQQQQQQQLPADAEKSVEQPQTKLGSNTDKHESARHQPQTEEQRVLVETDTSAYQPQHSQVFEDADELSHQPEGQRQHMSSEDTDELAFQPQAQKQQVSMTLLTAKEEKEIRKLIRFYSISSGFEGDAIRPLAPNVADWREHLNLLETSLVVIASPDTIDAQLKGKKRKSKSFSSFVKQVLETCQERKVPYLLLSKHVGDTISRKSTPGVAIRGVRPIHESELVRFIRLTQKKSGDFFAYTEGHWSRARACSDCICEEDKRRQVMAFLEHFEMDADADQKDWSNLRLGLDAVARCIKKRRAKLVVFSSRLWIESPIQVQKLTKQCIKAHTPCFLVRPEIVATKNWSDEAACLSRIASEHDAEYEHIRQLAANMDFVLEEDEVDTLSIEGNPLDAGGDVCTDTKKAVRLDNDAKAEKLSKKTANEAEGDLTSTGSQVSFSADEDPHAVDPEILRLEEEIRLLEASLSKLESRRTEVNAGLVNAQRKRSQLNESLSSLATRQQQLNSAHTQQLGLLQEMKGSLAKSRDCFARLSDYDTTLSDTEIIDLMPSRDEETGIHTGVADQEEAGEGHGLVTDREAQAFSNVMNMDEKISHVDDQSLASHDGHEEMLAQREAPSEQSIASHAEGSLFQDKGRFGQLLFLSDSTESDDIAPCQLRAVDDNSLDSFWKVAGDGTHRLATFLPSIQPAHLVQFILDVSARETLALDRFEPKGSHRCELMWNTCLDVGVIGSVDYPDNLDHDMSAAVPSGGNNGTLESSSAVEADRPRFPIENKRTIDPHVPLCPYELAGTCADPYCSFQHLDQRPLANVLPREFLPLPQLSLVPQPKAAAKGLALSQDLKSNSPTTRPGKRQRTGLSAYVDVEACSEENKKRREDFVSLSDTSGNVKKQPSSEENEGFGKEKPILPVFWWISEDKTRGFHLQSEAVSISTLLRNMGFRVSQGGAAISIAKENLPKTTVDACQFLGMIVDGIRVSVHAGRFDIANALRTLLQRAAESWGPAKSNKLITSFKRIVANVESLLKRVTVSAFAYDAVEGKHAFLVAFETQFILAVLSFFYASLHEVQQKEIQRNKHVSGASLRAWADSATHLQKLPDKDALSCENDFDSAFWTDLFEPKVWKEKRKGESDMSRQNLSILFGIFNVFQRGLHLRSKVAESSSIRFVIDQIIQPSWAAARRMLTASRGSEENEVQERSLKATLIVGNIVLGSLEFAANQAQDFAAITTKKYELTELYFCIDKVLIDLRRMLSRELSLELILSPLFAANLSLAAALQLYDRVQKRLENVLSPSVHSSEEDNKVPFGLNLSLFSELLWSQLVQLRATLPLYTGHNQAPEVDHKAKPEWDLPDGILEDHKLIASRIDALGVYPNHISLDNDWNIVHELSATSQQELLVPKRTRPERHVAKKSREEKIVKNGECRPNPQLRKLCYSMVHALLNHAKDDDPQRIYIDFSGRKLALRATRGRPSLARSAIPRSLMICGPSLAMLRLRSCELINLPYHFGHYFPNLKCLDLGRNMLKELPDSLMELANLEVLSIDSNQIQALPSEFVLSKLAELYAANNLLKEIPSSLSSCVELQVLHLADNPMTPGYWSVVAQLPKLREFTPQQ